MADDYEYFSNKRQDRVYVSPSLKSEQYERGADGELRELERPFRIVSKVVDCDESHQFIKDGKEVSLRVTAGERQEIVAKFYEDTRGIFTLAIQKYTKDTGVPHKASFTFTGAEISALYNFIRNVALVPLKTEGSIKLSDDFLSSLVLTHDQAYRLLTEHPGLLEEVLSSGLSLQDISDIGYRKEQLGEFELLLTDSDHFQTRLDEIGKNVGKEGVWQRFFERNSWIFGYGLDYVFNSPLEGKKLEQVIVGSDFTKSGKRVDALLKTKGMFSSLAFGEIKTHDTPLLSKTSRPYRSESWAMSTEVAGGIAQAQRAVQRSVKALLSKTELKDEAGNPTGEQLFLYQPKSFLVVGSLSEFSTENGINEEKFSSFELMRRNLHSPEIITFDELYERAKHIVASSSRISQLK